MNIYSLKNIHIFLSEVINITNSWLFIFLLLFGSIYQSKRNKLYLNVIKRKKKGRKRKMPEELIKEFIDQNCLIMLFNDSFGTNGKIISVEGNWIKVEEKNKTRLINGDMIRDISIIHNKTKK